LVSKLLTSRKVAQFSADLAGVSENDLAILKAARETAEAAETDAFNPAIAAAGKSTAEGKALQAGYVRFEIPEMLFGERAPGTNFEIERSRTRC
jgi:hypothetical protein